MAVTGIGGFFFRARDPKALSEWYKRHLGVEAPVWRQQAGPTAFAPFGANTDYFAADKQWMINFRVEDLDGMLAQLRADGIEIITKVDWDSPDLGRFRRIHDPEGNAIELWEPAPGHHTGG
jgi:predicted enzyme related to lactoylglutathione lyase